MAGILQPTFEMHFRTLLMLIPSSLKFVLKCPLDNNAAVFQVMAWHLTGPDSPIYASTFLNELTTHATGMRK